MKKKLITILLTVIMSVSMMNFVFAADDYPYSDKVYGRYSSADIDPWRFYYRECTSFVAWCLNSRNDVAFNNSYKGVQWGDASNWGSAARSVGITVDKNPAIGSVAWWSSGHVGWVASVNGSNVTIEEYNKSFTGTYNCRTIASSSITGFIHIKDISVSPPATPTISDIAINGLNISVYWSAVSDATQYTVDFCKVVNGTYNHDYYSTNSTYMSKTLSEGQYAIRVAAQNSAGSSANTNFWYIDVFVPVSLSFDANGGELERTKARTNYDATNSARGENQLIVYSNGGLGTGTNTYGVEVVVSPSQRVTNIIDHVGNAKVPYDGFILSGNGQKGQWLLDNINIGDYVNLHPNLQEACWVWTENGWLTWTKKVAYGNKYGNLPQPLERDGYTFSGWFTAAEGGTQVTSETIVNTNSDHTLYAHWEKQACTISYDLNGADGTIESQTFENGSNAYISSIKPTRSGYIFLGWARSASATEAEFQPSDEYTENTDITLYAVWKILPSTETSITKKSAYSLINTTVKNAENGNLILIATYKNGKMSDLQTEAYTGEDISVATFLPYDNVKVMIFDSLKSLKPLSIAETISN